MNVGNILTLIGGLGLFLYGMRVMSDSIEKPQEQKCVVFWLSLQRTNLWECCSV